MAPYLLRILLTWCMVYHVDPLLVQAIAQYESHNDIHAIGKAGEVGLLQLLPSSFKYSKDYLEDPDNNLRLGIAYLAQLKKECPFKVDNTFLVCYNRGVAGAHHVRNPKQDSYYKNIMKYYKELERVYAEN